MRGPRPLGSRTLFVKGGGTTENLRNKLFHSPLSVTDFITQYDEAGQLESKKKETKAMARGRQIHDSLLYRQNHFNFFSHANSEDPQDRVQVAGTVLDRIRTLNLHRQEGVRELRVRGIVGGYHLHGMIDYVKVIANELVIVEVKTTRNLDIDDCRLRLAYHQALFYRFLLQKMLEPSYDLTELGLREGDEAEGINEKLTSSRPDLFPADCSVENVFENVGQELAVLREWSSLASFVFVQFLNSSRNSQGEVDQRLYELPYDPDILSDITKFRLSLIRGEREPLYMPFRYYCPPLVVDDATSFNHLK